MDIKRNIFELVILDIRRQKTYRATTDLDTKYERFKDLMLIEDKVYFSRCNGFDEDLGSQVMECDPTNGLTRIIKMQESFREI
jgi:hypothetical protein